MERVSFTERAFPANKLALVVDVLGEAGISKFDVLRGTSVAGSDLYSTTTLISMQDLITGYRNAMQLCRDPGLAFRIGTAAHVSTYGMYGYALLCSVDFRRSMEFAVKYHPLATPLCSISFSEQDGEAHWTIEPALHPSIDAALQRFIVDVQIGNHLSLQRDVMGPSFTPSRVELVFSRGGDSGLNAEMIGCPVVFEQPANRMTFNASWLDRAPVLGSRTTYAAVVELCDNLLADMAYRAGVAGRVRSMLVRDIARRPTLGETAAHLKTTPRTLRRQLRQQGTSYRELLDELRVRVAMKFLKETSMTNEEIAHALGFSDAANFRHAFRRWTHTTPTAVRRDQAHLVAQ